MRKMPDPIVVPTTIATASKSVSSRRKPGDGVPALSP
jgi:hypothetical protein